MTDAEPWRASATARGHGLVREVAAELRNWCELHDPFIDPGDLTRRLERANGSRRDHRRLDPGRADQIPTKRLSELCFDLLDELTHAGVLRWTSTSRGYALDLAELDVWDAAGRLASELRDE